MKFDINREHKKLSYRKTNDTTLGNILIPYLRAYGLIDKYHESRAKQIWHETMGPTISTYTQNIYVKDRKLYITLSSSSLRQEISFSKHKIKDFINQEIGEDFLKGVIIW